MGKRHRRTRESGSVRKLPSGKWQARVHHSDGTRTPLGTFSTKREADQSLTLATSDQLRGQWIDPRRGQRTFEEYSKLWLEQRPLRPRTTELYEYLLRLHICPRLGGFELAELTPIIVRQWFSELSGGTIGPSTVAKCYRLLRTILTTAVEDELITRNPCVIKGAGVERSAERPVASVEQVRALADASDPRYRALILVATYTTLRLGELSALTRRRVDLVSGTISVVDSASEVGGQRIIGEPKTAAGRRTVTVPAAILPELVEHMARYAGEGPDGLIFCGPMGAPLRRANWNERWRATTKKVGLEHLRFHDLRHTGNTLAASTGASTKELMSRMGHASPRAALLYQHATSEREVAIARSLSALIEAQSA